MSFCLYNIYDMSKEFEASSLYLHDSLGTIGMQYSSVYSPRNPQDHALVMELLVLEFSKHSWLADTSSFSRKLQYPYILAKVKTIIPWKSALDMENISLDY